MVYTFARYVDIASIHDFLARIQLETLVLMREETRVINKTRTTGYRLGIIIAVILPIVTILVCVIFKAQTEDYCKAEAVADLFIGEFKQGNYNAARALMSADQRGEEGAPGLANAAKVYVGRHGDFIRFEGPMSWQVSYVGHKKRFLFIYGVKCANFSSTAAIAVRKDGGNWFVQGFRFHNGD